MKKYLFILALIFTVFGCTALEPFVAPIVSAGVQAYVMWKDGEASAFYACDLNTAYVSVKKVLSDMNYTIESDKPDEKGAYHIVAKSYKDTFKVTVLKTEDYVTEIKIRIDIMGNKPYAELIYKRLERQLDVIDFTKQKRRWHLFRNTEG